MERTYFEPPDLNAALLLLAEHRGASIVAGGTDLVVGARTGKHALPERLVAIHRLHALNSIQAPRDGGLHIGALVTHAELEASTTIRRSWSALSDGAALVGSPATRHTGTVGGNVCNASPAMELGIPLLVYEAKVELASQQGTRQLPLGSFLTGPGKTARQANELLVAVILPPLPGKGRAGSAYVRLEYRQAMEIAVVGAAALVVIDNGRCTEARIALTAVAPTCVRAPAAEKILQGKQINSDLLAQASASSAQVAKPIDDVRASAPYRNAMVPVIVERALTIARQRAR
jgi:CO/xanthine dehydrogenase FAD-binding subunit